MEQKDVLGASSPDNPALHMPDPLSITIGIPTYLFIFDLCLDKYQLLIDYRYIFSSS
jgi:hypothetical protein